MWMNELCFLAFLLHAMSRRPLKRKQPPKNAHSFIIIPDDSDEEAATSVPVMHRHEIIQGTSKGHFSTRSTYFSLMSSPKKTATGTFTLPPVENTDSLSSSQTLPYSVANVNERIDIIDYATSGNFDHTDFDLDLVSFQGSDSNVPGSEPQKKCSRNDGVSLLSWWPEWCSWIC